VAVYIDPPHTVALRIGPETYETAALPLSYVGADQEWPMLMDISYSPSGKPLGMVLKIPGITLE
jgi:hypothetical protein